MLNLDAVGRWIIRRTGRTLDQHATDPVPAAAHLPQAASDMRRARTELLLTVDRLRTALINEDDLTGSVAAVTGSLADIEQLGRDYRHARNWADTLITDPARTEYAAANTGGSLHRRYVNPGDTVLVVLPHTDSCRKQRLAGRRTRVRISQSDAELDPTVGPGQLRLPHADAGIYHDPAEGGTLYVLESAADKAAASDD
ncbi:hypothetical protein ACIG87_15280 [Micromonospora sp. NPDC051925]|uniref:hypothetical protein n=1 Tax=Micromonospora sp. NPDC051925 TaxID=3364288 RepID=UPI0037C606E4